MDDLRIRHCHNDAAEAQKVIRLIQGKLDIEADQVDWRGLRTLAYRLIELSHDGERHCHAVRVMRSMRTNYASEPEAR